MSSVNNNQNAEHSNNEDEPCNHNWECGCVEKENQELKNTIKTNNKHIEELKEQDRRRDEEIARLVGLLTEENAIKILNKINTEFK